MSNSGSPRREAQEAIEAGPSTSTDQAQAQPPPPPPPSALPFVPPPVDIKPSIPSAASSSSKPVWPHGFLLFLDPLSPSAIPKLVQNLSTLTNGHPPRQTAILAEATHIVIDPTSTFGDAVLQLQARQQPPSSSSPFLVTDQWLKQCILWSEWEDEQDFLFSKAREIIELRKRGGGGEGREEDVEMKELEEEEEDEESAEEEGKSGKLPNLPTSGRWLESEDDALARFLLLLENYTLRDQTGRDAFDRFAITEFSRRSGPACREHHRMRKENFDVRIDILRGGSGLGKPRKETRSGDGNGKGKERARVESSSECDSSDEGTDGMERRQVGGGVGSGIRAPYTAQEEADFIQCLKENGSVKAACKAMSTLHPRRTIPSCSSHYQKQKASYKPFLGTENDDKWSENLRWSTSEDNEIIRLIAQPHHSLSEVFRTFQNSYPDRTVPAISTRYHSQKTRFLHTAQLLKSSASTPRHSPVASGSNYNSNQPHQHQHSPPPQSPANSSQNFSFSPSPSSSSSPGFEPPSFLSLGVAPSSLPPSAPSCYWCGTGEDESEYFKMLELAEEDPSDAEEITKVDGRLACSFCVKRKEKWIARGDGGEREMGELEKLAWVGMKLEHSGKKERATLVRVRDGGTAEED